ncbi:uncharacterized protein At3g49140-like isoform X1 [Zingiber officinale]|uniref:uncharacterized protein At3g49140-like isoform X1 n=1 Tax=Zingiber officinale TaxID=94328 RepID=UPI001C4B06A2|nr:uncharacterized protein At3g49140-like isoform X1 [Zingiber officinale]XP_042381321.1 uncharacterized protein At3g49140-like isoform X1 [Zingiber officinale]
MPLISLPSFDSFRIRLPRICPLWFGRHSCSMSAGISASWINTSLDGRRGPDYSLFRCRRTYFTSMQSYWLHTTNEFSVSRVQVAADFSDSVPDSSKDNRNYGYHPLEELKERKKNKNKNMKLSDAEIARTVVEANNKALLIFPGGVHNEPHSHVSWAEFHYVIDDYGDIFFELFDDENILQDRSASSPVIVLIGYDSLIYGANNALFDTFEMDEEDGIELPEFKEIDDTEITDTLISWGMPDTLRYTHPLFFAKCITKVVQTKFEKVDFPSNGLQLLGCLRPAFIDEESYLRRLFYHDEDNYISDWRDVGLLNFNSKHVGRTISSTFYKLEIMTMDLSSVYGDQSTINLQDFQDAEPDLLANSASAIMERISEYGAQSSVALKALCRRRKGLNVEVANLIGVDSLGIDVRVYCGMEAHTLRFPFSARVISESGAEKKIKKMLFPQYHRKNLRTATDEFPDL